EPARRRNSPRLGARRNLPAGNRSFESAIARARTIARPWTTGIAKVSLRKWVQENQSTGSSLTIPPEQQRGTLCPGGSSAFGEDSRRAVLAVPVLYLVVRCSA